MAGFQIAEAFVDIQARDNTAQGLSHIGTNISNTISNALSQGFGTAGSAATAAGTQVGNHLGAGLAGGVAGGVQHGLNQGSNGAAAAGSQAGSKFGVAFAALAGGAIGGAIGDKAGEIFGKAKDMLFGAQDASAKLSAQLGLTSGDAARFAKDASNLFSNNFVGSVEEANDALKSVVLNIGGMREASDGDITHVTGLVSELAQTFDVDLGDATKAVGQMMKTGMAKDATEAMDIITVGFQKGVDKSGDFLDTLNEYGVQFQKLGIDGTTATGLLSQGLQAGARDADLVADALKEFSIRAIDGSTTTAAGFTALGLNTAQVSADIAAGGERAKNATQEVLTAMRNVEDPTQRAAIATELFGTQSEDLGKALGALNLDTAAAGMGNVAGAAQAVADKMGSSVSSQLTSIWNTLETTLTNLGSIVLPLISGGFSIIGSVLRPVLDGFSAMPKPVAAIALGLSAIVLLRGPLLGMLAAVKAGMMSAFANPIGLAIVAITTVMAALWSKSKEGDPILDDLSSSFDTTTGAITGTTRAMVASSLGSKGLLDAANNLRVPLSLVTDASMGLAGSHDALAAALSTSASEALKGNGVYQTISGDLDKAGISAGDLTKAMMSGDWNGLQAKFQAWTATLAEGSPERMRANQDQNQLNGLIAQAPGIIQPYKDLLDKTTTSSSELSKQQEDTKNKIAATAATAGAAAVSGASGESAYAREISARYAANLASTTAQQASNQAVAEAHPIYDAAAVKSMQLQEAQVLLATAVKGVHDAPAKDFQAMQADIDGVSKKTDAANTSLQAFAIQIDVLTGRNVPLEQSTKLLNDTVRDQAQAFKDATAATGGHIETLWNDKGVIDTTTAAGSSLYDSVAKYTTAYDTAVTSAVANAGAHATVAQKVDLAKTAADNAREKFLAQAEAMGISRVDAGKLADGMGILEGKRLTPKTLHLDAQDAASGKVDALNSKIQNLSDKTVKLVVDASGGTMRINSDGSFRTSSGATGMATGGHVRGPGTGTSDSIPTWLSNGEYVVNAAATAANLPLLHALNARKYATGGLVNVNETAQGSIQPSIDSVNNYFANATASASRLNAAAAALANSIPKANSGGTEQWRALAMRVASVKGENSASVQVMLNQMSRESSGNPTAINLTDSNAQAGHPSKGLLQFIQGTFDSYADPGFNSNIWDPESQMHAWYNYINSQYGGYQSFGARGYGAYAGGGYVRGQGTGTSDSNLARISNGEFVMNARATSENRQLLEEMNSGSGGSKSKVNLNFYGQINSPVDVDMILQKANFATQGM